MSFGHLPTLRLKLSILKTLYQVLHIFKNAISFKESLTWGYFIIL